MADDSRRRWSPRHRSTGDFGHGRAVDIASTGGGPTTPTRRARPGAGTGPGAEIAPRGPGSCSGSALGLVLFAVFGNHESNVEDWWMFALAGLTVLWLVAGEAAIKKRAGAGRARRPGRGRPRTTDLIATRSAARRRRAGRRPRRSPGRGCRGPCMGRPAARTRRTNSSWTGRGEASHREPGVGFSGIRLTCTSRSEVPAQQPAEQVRPPRLVVDVPDQRVLDGHPAAGGVGVTAGRGAAPRPPSSGR